MTKRQRFKINSLKYDLSTNRSWHCELVSRLDPLIVLSGEFVDAVDHPSLGFIAQNTISTEYFWLDRWFNIFEFREPGGSLRNWYCNVAMPPEVNSNQLDFVDLDIDLVVWPDGRIETLDMDEFAVNAERFNYPAEVIAATERAPGEIRELIETREFPFDKLAARGNFSDLSAFK